MLIRECLEVLKGTGGEVTGVKVGTSTDSYGNEGELVM